MCGSATIFYGIAACQARFGVLVLWRQDVVLWYKMAFICSHKSGTIKCLRRNSRCHKYIQLVFTFYPNIIASYYACCGITDKNLVS